MAQVIDCKVISKKWKDEIREDVAWLKTDGIIPTLVVIQTGDDPASTTYINNKKRACEDVGIRFIHEKYNDGIPMQSSDYVIKSIQKHNQDPAVSGIMVQLPVLEGYEHCIRYIDFLKDVDGLSAHNVAALHSKYVGGHVTCPCTPEAIYRLLLDTKGLSWLSGKHAVIIGRSEIVGKPIAEMLLSADCTTTICHSKTINLADITRQADILIVAAGCVGLVTGNMVKPGAFVVDVGINRVDGKLVGDVDFDTVKDVAGYITPVPGGIGVLTVTQLLENVVELASMQERIKA